MASDASQKSIGLKRALYGQLFSVLDDVVFSVDTRFSLSGISPNISRVLGYDETELTGRPIHELGLVHPDDAARVESNMARLLSGEELVCAAYRFLTREGAEKIGEVRAVPLREEGKVTGALCLARDISDRVRFESALRESEERYRLLAENAQDVIWVLDKKLNYVYVSPSSLRLRGFTPEEVMKRPLNETLTPDSYRRAMEVFSRERLLERQGSRHGPDWSVALELEMFRRDGSTIWTEVNVSLLFGEDGLPRGLLGFTRDISGRKRSEEELSRYRQHLEEMVEGRTEELVKANALLQEEVEVRIASEKRLRARELELEDRQRALEDMNIALKVLIRHRSEDRDAIEKNVVANINSALSIYLDKLKTTGMKADQLSCVAAIESQLMKIGRSFIRELSSEQLGLSPAELRVAYLIKEGKSSKEIAGLLNVSLNAVLFHRNNIRRKTGLKNHKVNLVTHLQNLDQGRD